MLLKIWQIWREKPCVGACFYDFRWYRSGTLVKNGLISLDYFYKNFYNSPANKSLTKVIFVRTKSVIIYISLVRHSSWNHCFQCKLAVEVFPFDMLPTWVIYQIISIFIPGLSNSWLVQNSWCVSFSP